MEEQFTFFWSGPFSNWHQAPFQIGTVWYNCSEQYMMAEKARMFGDGETLQKIMNTADPSDQKRYGREVKGFDKDKWDALAMDIVYKGCYAKFTQNSKLKQFLLNTVGTTMVEASPKDIIWGIGLDKTNPLCFNRDTWRGTNWLGIVLTKVRESIIKELENVTNI